MSPLFDALKVGRMSLQHRMALAPMTRTRASASHVPLPSVKEYYAQRAAVPGTLLVTEATVISPRHGGYPNVPGIYNEEQLDAWREVTAGVHAQGSFIYLQLWALGRAANPGLLQQQNLDLLSSSAVPMKSAFSDEMHQPRAMTEAEIHGTIQDFATAAQNAIRAGFDGVEIHGANGYLVDQFIQDVSNRRTDSWGGDIPKRSRFAVEVTRAVVDAVGNDRTAIRLSPWSKYQGMGMADPVPQFSDLAQRLADFRLAYLHACESDGAESLDWLMEAYGNASPVVVAGSYSGETARQALEQQYRNRDVVVAFGRPFVSNPDLPFRVKNKIPFAPLDPKSLYAQASEGYTDYKYSDEYAAVSNSA
ncbi:FMN-linked oxidoreductase [Aspergillus sclerotiicarbonarius CBS 121057]|uniref:FMN-linked oxidoreductase n=1 Tax=Aspergillus sclerotiicarbonarius (strain CBS 121057 / IBT 28362) TaxID=1448318 RepID=A0A319F5E8_ASPSB|nr:FMN-linked oxidoreductase [Aspergillus sclerotiicarbonarius CBS 121057]